MDNHKPHHYKYHSTPRRNVSGKSEDEVVIEAAFLKKVRHYADFISNYSIYIIAILFLIKIYLDHLESGLDTARRENNVGVVVNDTIINMINDNGRILGTN